MVPPSKSVMLFHGCIWVGLLLLVGPISAPAMQPYAEFADIAHTADAVFVGTVSSTSCRLGPKQNTILTDVTFEDVTPVSKKEGVTRGIKSGMVLTFEGGQLGDIGLTVSDVPTFVVGRKYVLFTQMIAKNDSNPLIGGPQGVFEVAADPVTGVEYAMTSNGAGVVAVSNGRLRTLSRVRGIENGTILRGESPRTVMSVPVSADGLGGKAITRVEESSEALMTLDQFIAATQATLAAAAPERSAFGFATKAAQTLESTSVASGRIPTSSLLQRYLAGEDLSKMESTAKPGAYQPEGDTLNVCGYFDIPIVMEQVSELDWTYSHNAHGSIEYNKYMDIFRYTDDDGSFGSNSENEFCGLITDSMKDNAYGTGGFGSALAVCRSWYTWSSCGEMDEADIMFNGNPGNEWTGSFSQSLGTNKILYLPVMMHELGHCWGMHRGGTEHYNYDVPSVMHAYYSNIVEDGEGIHTPEARGIRINYDDQTSILDYRDLGVESYYAQDGLHNAVTDRFNDVDNGSYTTGEIMMIEGLTIENMAHVDCPGFELRLYLSTDRTVHAFTDYLLGTWNWPTAAKESLWVGDLPAFVPAEVPNGTYYIVASLMALNNWETVVGTNNQTSLFHTVHIASPAPTAPTGVDATDGTASNAVVVTWDAVAGAAHYEIWRNTSSIPDSATQLVTTGLVTQYLDTSATPGTTYYYWVKSVSGGGTVSGFSTSNTGWRKLSFPNNVQASDGASTAQVVITWDAVEGASHYRVYKHAFNESAGAVPLTGWITTRQAVHTESDPAQTWYYWILAAVDGSGYRATVLNDFASDSGYKALAPITGVQASDGTYSDRIEVTWNAAPVTASYRVYRGTTTNPAEATALSNWQSGTTYSDTTAELDVTYYYFVIALANSRQSDYSNPDMGFLAWPPVAAPTGVAASDGTYTGYTRITWNAVSGATHYRVYRSQSSLSVLSGPITDWISATSFNDTTVSPGLTMYYWVKAAINTEGGRASAFSSSNTGWRKLSPPTGLAATGGAYPDKIVVSWNAAPGANYYMIHRAETNNVLDALPLTGWISGTSYEDAPGNVCSSYYYWLQSATSSSGSRASDLSSLPAAGYRSLNIPAAPSASDGASQTQITVTWGTVPGATYYRLYRNTVDDPNAASPQGVWTTSTSYNDIYADPGEDYFYWVKAASSSSGTCSSGFSPSDSGWRMLPAATNVVATDGTYDNRVRVSWSQSSSYAACRVLRGQDPNVALASPISDWIWPRSFDDTSAAPGTIYYYWVEAAAGDGAHATNPAGPDLGHRVTAAPTNVIASKGTYRDFVHVRWTAVPEATHYRVYRDTYNIPASSVPVSDWITDLQIEDTTAQPTVYYYYWIKAAIDGTGTGMSQVSGEDIGWRGTAPPVIVSVLSRRTHGSAGSFDVNVTSESGVEPRSGGPRLLVVQFDKPIQDAEGRGVDAVRLSSGTVTGVTLLPDQMTLEVALQGVQDDLVFSARFPGISDAYNPVAVVNDMVCFRALIGDVDLNGSVNIFDLLATRSKLSQPVAAGTFKTDVIPDGTISIFDLLSVRANLNQTATGECPSSFEN